MIDQQQIKAIIRKARQHGATVTVTYDEDARREEGREIIESVAVANLPGVGPHPMGPIGAYEAISAALAKLPAPVTVREFSPAGPCLTAGPLVRETAKFFVYRDDAGKERRIGKRGSLVHTEPCRCCRDHAASMYPNGYEN